MSIDIAHVEASIRRFYKTTRVLAAKASGMSEGELIYFPVIVNTSERVWAVTVTTNKPDSDFYTPYIVNGAFCLEMLLKSVIYHERNEWLSGHNLINLYQNISTERKREINEHCKRLYKESSHAKEVVKQLKQKASINIRWNVASLLLLSAESFQHWRYAFDLGRRKSCFIGFYEIYESLDMVNKSLTSSNRSQPD